MHSNFYVWHSDIEWVETWIKCEHQRHKRFVQKMSWFSLMRKFWNKFDHSKKQELILIHVKWKSISVLLLRITGITKCTMIKTGYFLIFLRASLNVLTNGLEKNKHNIFLWKFDYLFWHKKLSFIFCKNKLDQIIVQMNKARRAIILYSRIVFECLAFPKRSVGFTRLRVVTRTQVSNIKQGNVWPFYSENHLIFHPQNHMKSSSAQPILDWISYQILVKWSYLGDISCFKWYLNWRAACWPHSIYLSHVCYTDIYIRSRYRWL